MSPSSTSSSNSPSGGWKRLRRLGLIVLAVLIGLELFFRLPIVQPLQPYADLLWYDVYLASYTRALRQGTHHDLWLSGSSYMMTGLDPSQIQQQLATAGLGEVSVQNYGLNLMQNLEVMAQVYDRWLFELDQPDYLVLAIASGNFAAIPRENQAILNSTLERMLIFPSTLEDHVAGFLYQNSALVHYGILLRNIVDPRDVEDYGYFMDVELPLGGYEAHPGIYTPATCDLSQIDAPAAVEALLRDSPQAASVSNAMSQSLQDLDTFIDVVQQRGIPLAIVIIPDQACEIGDLYGSYANYDTLLMTPILDHLQARDVPVLNLTPLFRAEVPPAAQPEYYANHNHPNQAGAALFSPWTGRWIADWLHDLAENQGTTSPTPPA